MGVVSALGNSVNDMFQGLVENKTGVKAMDDWRQYVGLGSYLGSPAEDFTNDTLKRHQKRTMSPMSEMALHATKQALLQADLNEIDRSRSLLCMGSTLGSPQSFFGFYKKFFDVGGPKGQLGTSFFKVMNHSVAANVAVALEFSGATLAPSSACCTSSQAIAMGWELIQSGLYDLVIAGGADEMHHTSAAIFDIVGAASTNFNDRPNEAPRPFDRDRDGLVVSEGAGVVILESEEHAQKRGVKPIAELRGGVYASDGVHMAHPQSDSMAQVMKSCLERTGVDVSEIGYVNAHATGTEIGDREEIVATQKVVGTSVPVSSLKGHFGHSLAACGVIESIASIEMMNTDTLIGTRNLANIDQELVEVDFVTCTRKSSVDMVLVNNFAFGGVATSLIFGKIG
jgi:3-oxoacyl-[acyl-carrier-protein] synthase II